jgi:hypothetical protein
MKAKMPEKTIPKGLTGRDEWIITQALVYAILTIDRLPHRWRPYSDQTDMKRILGHMVPNDHELARMIEQTRRRMDAKD